MTKLFINKTLLPHLNRAGTPHVCRLPDRVMPIR